MSSSGKYGWAWGAGLLVTGLGVFVAALGTRASGEVAGQTIAAPEFPTVFLPVSFILGIMGVTLLFTGIREE